MVEISDELLLAGRKMANILFNLQQRGELIVDEIRCIKETREEWDAALTATLEERKAEPVGSPPRDEAAMGGTAVIEKALRIGQSYVLDAMRNDGGIENCEIGYRTDFEAIRDAISCLAPAGNAEPVAWREFDHETIDYVMQYGGRCRECADHFGLCPNGLPCEPDDARTAIRWVLKALNYGIRNGFLPSPALASPSDREAVNEALVEALKPFATFKGHKTSYVELPVRWCIAAAEALTAALAAASAPGMDNG